MTGPNDWAPLLESFMAALESQGKDSQPRIAEWLIDWLEHRTCDEQAGYLLGHMGGNTALLTSVLVTFAGPSTGDDWARCSDQEVAWAMEWAQRMQQHLRLHPESRQARGLPPLRRPVMVSPVPIPDELLWSEGEEPRQDLHGDLPAAQLDRVIALDSGTDRQLNETVESSYETKQEEAELAYSASLHTPTPEAPEPPRKVRVLMVEVGSSGSTDMPRRTLRVPLDEDGQASLSIAIRLEDEVDREEVETQPVPVHEVGPPLSGFLGLSEAAAGSAAGGSASSSPVEPAVDAVDAVSMTQADDASTGPMLDGP